MKRKNLTYTLGCVLLPVAIYFLLCCFKYIIRSPSNENVLYFDAGWYNQIREFGYIYKSNSMCNMAFFPFFPYLWKFTMLSPIGISILNVLIFIFAFALSLEERNFKKIYVLALVTTPSFIFFFLPYSESVFFLFGVLLLRGFQHDNKQLVYVGLLGCGLTRSVAIVFIPAIIVSELICYFNTGRKENILIVLKRIIFQCLASLTGVFVIALMQRNQTGSWFYFIEIQKFWGRHFQLPSLPFTTGNPSGVLGVDGIALIIGMIAFYLFLTYAFKTSNNKSESSENTFPKPILFATIYIIIIAFLDSFFTNDFYGKTTIWSIGRHILCTPFFIYFLNWLMVDYKPKIADLVFINGLILLGLFFVELINYPYQLAYYLVYLLVFINTISFKGLIFKKYSLFFYPIAVLNLYVMVIFYQSFLYNNWIG